VPYDALDSHFESGAVNIGIVLGDLSHGLVDVDLDDPQAIYFLISPVSQSWSCVEMAASRSFLGRRMRRVSGLNSSLRVMTIRV
jgi:hypothetical protein